MTYRLLFKEFEETEELNYLKSYFICIVSICDDGWWVVGDKVKKSKVSTNANYSSFSMIFQQIGWLNQVGQLNLAADCFTDRYIKRSCQCQGRDDSLFWCCHRLDIELL